MIDVRHYLVEETLRNGTAVVIRAIRPNDKEKLANAFKELDPESVYTRFFRHVKELTDRDLRLATEIDFDREVALVVTTGLRDEETVIGSGRYAVCEETESGRGAEVAFLVEEDYQGLGIASRLLRHLVQIGRQMNVSRFTASVLSANQAMLRVFAGSGLPMKQQRDGTVIEVTLSLAETGSQSVAEATP
jgi:RimJ/RimL family protein N-acetyltransferase